MHPKTIMWKTYYPRLGINKQYVDDIYTLWNCTWMFKHTKKFTNFSLFQSTINLEYPHITGYYILFYTTKCEEGEKHNYTFNELLLVVNNCNHGALYCNPKQFDNSHYFLLRTFPLDKSLKDAMINLFESINYILKYGQFPPEFDVNTPLHRWGKPRIRAYNFSDTMTISPIPSLNTMFNIQDVGHEIVNTVNTLFLEYYKSAGIIMTTTNVTQLPISKSAVEQFSRKRNIVEVDEQVFIANEINSKLLQAILPNYLSYVNNKKPNHKEFKIFMKDKFKMIYNKNEAKIKSIQTLDLTLSNAVIDLTKEDDVEEDEEENTQTHSTITNSENTKTTTVEDNDNYTTPIKGRKRNKKNIDHYFN